MRIGILTQPLANNYGGILQNYALQYILRNMGHDVETLNSDILKISRFVRILLLVKRVVVKYILRRSIRYVDAQQEIKVCYRENNREIIRFINNHICVRDVNFPLKRSFVLQNGYDAYLVGSDQVWRKEYTNFLSTYFLNFIEDNHTIRLSYAASFGVDKLDKTKYNTRKIGRLLSRFNAVSVRESSAVDICLRQLNVKAEVVLDPTMLLSKSDYVNLLQLQYNSKRYMAVYILDLTEEKQKIVSELSAKYNLDIIYAGRYGTKISPSIECWLETILNAQFVVTDSFHGTVFSVIFEKEFIALVNPDRGLTRLDSLFNMFNIPSTRLIATQEAINTDVEEINYEFVKAKIAEMRDKSLNFLNNTLR